MARRHVLKDLETKGLDPAKAHVTLYKGTLTPAQEVEISVTLSLPEANEVVEILAQSIPGVQPTIEIPAEQTADPPEAMVDPIPMIPTPEDMAPAIESISKETATLVDQLIVEEAVERSNQIKQEKKQPKTKKVKVDDPRAE